jgi:hypothetical protein
MDPSATLRDLLEAAENADYDAYRESAYVLYDWLAGGGFRPTVIPERES